MDDARGVGPGQRVRDGNRDPQALRRAASPGAGSTSSSVLPATYSMTMKSMPSADSISWMVTMFGWLRAEAARASWMKRRRRSLVRHSLGGKDLDRDDPLPARRVRGLGARARGLLPRAAPAPTPRGWRRASTWCSSSTRPSSTGPIRMARQRGLRGQPAPLRVPRPRRPRVPAQPRTASRRLPRSRLAGGPGCPST